MSAPHNLSTPLLEALLPHWSSSATEEALFSIDDGRGALRSLRTARGPNPSLWNGSEEGGKVSTTNEACDGGAAHAKPSGDATPIVVVVPDTAQVNVAATVAAEKARCKAPAAKPLRRSVEILRRPPRASRGATKASPDDIVRSKKMEGKKKKGVRCPVVWTRFSELIVDQFNAGYSRRQK